MNASCPGKRRSVREIEHSARSPQPVVAVAERPDADVSAKKAAVGTRLRRQLLSAGAALQRTFPPGHLLTPVALSIALSQMKSSLQVGTVRVIFRNAVDDSLMQRLVHIQLHNNRTEVARALYWRADWRSHVIYGAMLGLVACAERVAQPAPLGTTRGRRNAALVGRRWDVWQRAGVASVCGGLAALGRGWTAIGAGQLVAVHLANLGLAIMHRPVYGDASILPDVGADGALLVDGTISVSSKAFIETKFLGDLHNRVLWNLRVVLRNEALHLLMLTWCAAWLVVGPRAPLRTWGPRVGAWATASWTGLRTAAARPTAPVERQPGNETTPETGPCQPGGARPGPVEVATATATAPGLSRRACAPASGPHVSTYERALVGILKGLGELVRTGRRAAGENGPRRALLQDLQALKGAGAHAWVAQLDLAQLKGNQDAAVVDKILAHSRDVGFVDGLCADGQEHARRTLKAGTPAHALLVRLHALANAHAATAV